MIFDNYKKSYSSLRNKKKKIGHSSLYSYNDTDNIKEQKNPDLNNKNKNNSSSSLSKIFKNIKSAIKMYDLNVEENRLMNMQLKRNDNNNIKKVMINEKDNKENENIVYKGLSPSSNHYLNLMNNKVKIDLK